MINFDVKRLINNEEFSVELMMIGQFRFLQIWQMSENVKCQY